MARKRPFAWLGIVTIAGTKDSIRPSVFPIYANIPEEPNAFGHYPFALPMNESIEFSTIITSWIAHLPNGVIFMGQRNPAEKNSWLVSFDEVVIMVSDSKTNQRTRFLTPNGVEVPIQSADSLDCLMAAFQTEVAARTWTEEKTAKFIAARSEQPS